MQSLTLPKFPRICATSILAATLSLCASARAQTTYYWDSNDSTSGFGTAGGTWAAPTTNNSTQGWSTSATGVNALSGTTNTTTADALNFGTGTAPYGLGGGTITVSGTVSANSLTFGSQSGAIILSGGTISLGGTTPTVTVNNAVDTISSAITGSAGLTKNGTGTLTLSGNNTYTGATTLNAGKLSVGNNSAFGTSSVVVNSSSVIIDSAVSTSYTLSNNITLNTRGTIGATAAMGNLTLGGIISGTGDLKVDATAGVTTLTGLNTFTGNLIVDRATEGLSFNSIANAGVASAVGAGSSISLGVGTSSPTFTYTGNTAASSNRSISLTGAGVYITSRNAPLTLSGNVTSTSQSLYLQGNAGGGANFNELSGIYSGGGSLNVQAVAGDVWKISGNNTYTGITYSLWSATTIAGHSNAFGSTANGTQVTQNSQIILTGNISVGAEALTLNSNPSASWNGQTGAALRSYSGNNSWAGAITLGQATTIATNSGAGLTLSGGITGTNQNLIFNSIGNTIASGNIATGTGTLTKIGAGNLTLSGNNTYTGNTTISAGTLEIGASGRLGAGNYTQNIVNNGTFIYSGTNNQTLSGIISGTGAITQNAASTLTLVGNNTYTGATALNAGMIQIGHASGLGVGGNITFAGGGLQYGSGMTVDISSRLKNSASAILIDTNGNNVTFASAVGSTNSGGLTKNGTGTLTLTNANTYSGGTTINAGTLSVTNNSALGSSNVSVAAGGKLVVGADNLTIANNITLNGTTTNGAIFSNQSGAGVTTNLTGQITLNATSNVSTWWNNKTLQLSGKITGVGGLDFVLQPGSVGGRYLITGATNDYAGATSVTGSATAQFGYTGQAMLYLGATNALPTTTALTLNYADLYLNGQAQTLASISGSGNFSVQNGSATAATLTLGSGNTTSTFSGTIKNNGISVNNTAASPATVTGTVALTKIGTGTLTLSGNNTYTGATTISAGTLALGANQSLGAIEGAGALDLSTYTLTTTASTNNTLSGVVVGSGNLIKAGTGTLTLSGNNTYTGTTTVNAGTLEIGASGRLGAGNYTQNIVNNGTFIYSGTNNQTLSGIISGTGSLIQNGVGSTLTINSSSTFSGAKTINAGTLRLAAPGTVTIYGGNSTVNINNGSTLQLGFVAGMANNPVLTGLIVNIDSSGGGTVALDGINGLIQTAAGVTFNTTGGAQSQLISLNNGFLNDQGGNRPVLFNVASGSNATADFLVTGGMMQSAITKNGTGKLLFNNMTVGSTRITDININQGTMEFGGTSTLNQAAGFVFANNGTLAWNSTASQTLSNNITGTGSLTKSNTSTLTLSGNNTYTGTTTVNAGTLAVSGNISSSAVTVNAGGVISAGSAAAVTKFNAASLTLSADSGYAFTIGNISGGTAGTAGTDYDQIATSGALTFNNTLSNPFTVYLNGTPTNWSSTGNYTWNIMSGSSISGFSSANFFANTSGFGSSLDAGSAWTFGTSGGNLTLTYNVSAVPTWSGGTGTWSTGFTPSLSNNSNILFTGAGGNATNDIASGAFSSIGTLTFNSTAGSYTLAANSGSAGNGSSLAIGNSIVNNSANAQTINTDLSFAATRIINTASGSISIGGVISGLGALSKSGSNTLTLSGNNTYSGGTTLSAGTISVTNANGLGNGSVAAAANTKLFLAPTTGNMTIANAITLAGGGLGSIEVSGTVTTTGLITLTGGTDFRGSNLIIGGGITSANNSAVSFNPTTTVNSTISIGTGDLTISSASTRINTAGNTFGNITINFNGNLTLGINNALPSSTKVRFGFSSAANSVATLNLNGYNQTVASLEGGSGNFDTQNQNITGGGVLTVNQIAAQAFSYGGRITDGATATSLTKNGSGTLMLQNWSGINSTYSGATTINAGTLMILAGNGTSLSASSAYTVASGAVLSVNGTSQRIGSLAGAGTVQNGNATTATTLTVGVDNTSTTFSGVLQNGGAAALAITKNGTGALTLAGTNTYTGATTVNGGTLQLSSNITSSALTLGTGSVISIGNTTATAKYNAASVTIQGGSGYALTIANVGASVAGTDYDQLAATGALTLSNTVASPFTIYLNGTPTAWSNSGNYSWNIISAASQTGFSSGNFVVDFANFGIAAPDRTGLWSFTNPSGGLLTLNYAAAGDSFWTGTSGNWSTGFTPTPPSTDQNIFFSGSGGTATNDIASGTLSSLNFITFNATAGAYTLNATTGAAGLAGGTVFNIKGDIINNSASTQTINMNLGIGVSSTGGFAANAGNMTIGGVISGAGALNKAGNSTLTLAGANTYTGATTVNAGTLNLTGNLSGGTAISARGSGVLTQGSASIISGTSSFTHNSTGTSTLAGANTYSGATTLNAGTLNLNHATAIGSGVLTITGGTLNNTSGGAITLTNNNTQNWNGDFTFAGTNGNLNMGLGAVTMNASRTITVSNGTLTAQGLISGSGFGLTKNGSGTLTINSSSTFTGAKTVNAGTLRLVAPGGNAFGSNNTVNINNGSTLQIGWVGSNTPVFHGNTVNFDSNGGGTLLNDGLNGWIQFGGFFTINTNGGAQNQLTSANSGIYNDQTSNGGLILNVASGSNATADLLLAVGGSYAITKNGTGKVLVTASPTLRGISINNGVLEFGGSSTPTFSASLAFTNNGTFSYNSTASSTISQNITGTGNLTKSNTSTLTLSGANTFSGSTAISAGNLSISSVSSLGSTSGINLSNATALIYTGGAAALDRSITISTGTGTIRNSGSGLLTLSGALTKNGTTLTLAGGSSGITVSGVISGSSANSDLIVDGGTVNLTNTNTYNGPTYIINSGTLNANAVGALPTSTLTAVTINGSSTLALGASQSVASLSGTSGSTVNLNANTLTVNGSSTTTYSGGISGTGNLVKNGSGTQTLAGATTYTGATTVNSGTLTAAATNALGNSTVINVTGGSFLVTAANAVNDNAAVNLDGGRLAVSGNFDETVGLLTLSANSVIDFSGFVGTLRFSGIGSWANSANLAIWNWSGTTQYGTQINNYANPSNIVFTDNSNLASNLALISFYSDSGSSFVGNGFEQGFSPGGGSQIIAVPETETYFYAVALLAGVVVQYIRRRAKRKSLGLYPQT